MLHKDEYNQDEYNEYYAQETRGAEILGKKDSGRNKKILIIILLLTLISVGGYFGWKGVKSSKATISSDINKTEKSKNREESYITKRDNQQDTITKEVKEAMTANNVTSKMSPEDIANIVQIVMKKINQQNSNNQEVEQPQEQKSLPKTQEQIQDNKLLESLENSEVDSLVSQLESANISEEDRNKKAEKREIIDTYNKKVVPSEKLANDDLSKLSNDISNVIEDENDTTENKNSIEYAKEINREVKERKKEMRYIIVKKGDTLGKIAKRVYGNVMMYKKIYEANPDILRRPDRIYVGQKLRVPE